MLSVLARGGLILSRQWHIARCDAHLWLAPGLRAFHATIPSKKASKNAEKRAKKEAEATRAAQKLFAVHFEREQFGSRMPGLVEALEKDSAPGAFLNRYSATETRIAYLINNAPAERCVGVSLPSFTKRDGRVFTGAQPDRNGTLCAYHIDAASLLAAQALEPKPDDSVLDMCAAPGGKSLAIAQFLSAGGSITANDVSPSRRKRLADVMSLYLPSRDKRRRGGDAEGDACAGGVTVCPREAPTPATVADASAAPPATGDWEAPVPPTVRITGFDATMQGAFGSDTFDRVLLDAPCSSDRHLLRDPEELAKWGPGRIKANAARQAALLACALDAARPGGTVVYSTCALSNRENDDVVARVLARLPFPAVVVPLAFAFGEATPLGGWHVLPDTGLGFGPLYICKLVKGTSTVPRGIRGDYSNVVPVACAAETAVRAAERCTAAGAGAACSRETNTSAERAQRVHTRGGGTE